MPDSFDLNNQSRAADTAPQIPTSASEVDVRTMASDLELMGKSGGMVGHGAPQGMQVPVTMHPLADAVGQPTAGQAPQPPAARGKHILITVAVVLGVLGLFALGYFGIGYFVAGN